MEEALNVIVGFRRLDGIGRAASRVVVLCEAFSREEVGVGGRDKVGRLDHVRLQLVLERTFKAAFA